jgi:hypothetical protein
MNNVMEQIKQAAFEDELQKIAADKPTTMSAIEKRVEKMSGKEGPDWTAATKKQLI